MDTMGCGLTGVSADEVARCGAVLVGPAGGDGGSFWDWSARLLVGAAFRHLCAVRGARPPAPVGLLAFVRRPAGAVLADLAASPDDGARGAAAALGPLGGNERVLAGVVARAGDLLDRVGRDSACGTVRRVPPHAPWRSPACQGRAPAAARRAVKAR